MMRLFLNKTFRNSMGFNSYLVSLAFYLMGLLGYNLPMDLLSGNMIAMEKCSSCLEFGFGN